MSQKIGWRERLGFFVIFLSLALGLSTYRFFPFSDFAIFAWVSPRADVIGLQTVDQNGETRAVPAEDLFPFSRLSFNQSYLWILRYRRDPELAVRWMYDRIAQTSRAKALRVVRMSLEPEPEAEPPYRILKTEILHEMAY